MCCLWNAAARALFAGLLVLLLPAIWMWGAFSLGREPSAAVPGVALRIVQPDVPQQEKWREDNARSIFDNLLRLSSMPTAERPEGIGGITLVVWPESAVPFLIDESAAARAELQPLLGGRTVLLTGAIRLDRKPDAEPDVHNSIIVFDGSAAPVAHYDKWRLVPGGEFLPLGWLLEPLGFRKVVKTPGSFVAGQGPVTLTLPGGLRAALSICYEAIFPDGLIAAGPRPQLILNVTNDGWFGRSTGPWQHLAQARLRAIEQGLPVIRAANTGNFRRDRCPWPRAFPSAADDARRDRFSASHGTGRHALRALGRFGPVSARHGGASRRKNGEEDHLSGIS